MLVRSRPSDITTEEHTPYSFYDMSIGNEGPT